MSDDDAATTRDAFYDGRLLLRQRFKGHRSGTDAVLLAAAVPSAFEGALIDAGSGVGAAGLGVAVLRPQARVLLLENDPAMLDLAAENIEANALGARAGLLACDLLDKTARRAVRPKADIVVTNPPFYAAGTIRPSPTAQRRSAHVLPAGATLADWSGACVELLRPKGALIIIIPTAGLPEVMAALDRRLGAITLMAIHPRDGEPAKRVLLRGIEGSAAPFAIAPPLLLHEAETFTDRAAAIHRGALPLTW